jgi:hypothetical protein
MPNKGLYVYHNGEWYNRNDGSVDSFVLGVTEPDSTNTGIAANGLSTSDLTIVSGDQTIHDANVPVSGIIENIYYKGFVSVTLSTKTLKFRNCYFEGRTFTYNEGTDQPPAGALVQCNGIAQPVSFEFCTAKPIQPSYGLDCLAGSALGTVSRCDVSQGEDLLYYVGYTSGQTPWMKVYGNYIHDFSFWDDDPQRAGDSPAGWTHNDGLQCTGSLNGEIIGNSIKAYVDPNSGDPSVFTATYPNGACNSCLMLTISAGPHQNLLIQNNWFQGGIAGSVQMPYQSKTWNTSCSWDVSGNRFGTSMHPPGSGPTYHYNFIYFGYNLGPSSTDYHNNTFNGSDPYTPAGLGGTPATETAVVNTGTAQQTVLRYTSTGRISGT